MSFKVTAKMIKNSVYSVDTSNLAVLTVTFNPDFERLRQQIAALPTNCHLVVVDNASSADAKAALENLLTNHPKTALIRNKSNLGLAAALNQAATHARTQIPPAEFILLMDQDSVPAPGAIDNLLGAYLDLESQGLPVGCVGPRLIDNMTGLQHGFHCIKGWRWTRVYPAEDSRNPVRCTNLNGSGTLMCAEFFQTLGGLDEAFFIDHVDTEWAFRVLSHNRLLFGIPWARFDHSMGDRGLRFWCFGWRVWPQRSPRRHYFLFRNAVWLMRKKYVPLVWKVWAAIKLALTATVHLTIDHQRSNQLREMFSGLKNGVFEHKKPLGGQRKI